MARVETVRGGTASRYALRGGAVLAGCIYRADGTKVALSERFSGYGGDVITNDNPEHLVAPDAEPLPGRSLYLGHFMAAHYGHFITETLSTFWYFEEEAAATFDAFLFHPFVFGTDLPDYARVCFERFGIEPGRIRLVGATALRCDEIVVPERLFRLNHSADPRLRRVYDRIALARASGHGPRRLYLSRRRVSARTGRRVLANERRVESLFRGYGFEVVYPETVRFPDQVAMYAEAEAIAGCSGSALHNSVFMRPGALVIELGDPRYRGAPAPTQRLCDRISGVRSRFVPFEGRRLGRLMFVRVDPIAAALASLFGGARRAGWNLGVEAGVLKDCLHFAVRSTLHRLRRRLSAARRRAPEG